MHIQSLSSVQLERPSIVTVGVFDGVHLGHQFLLERLVQQAHQNNHAAVVMTFYPHPDVVLRGIEGRYYLTTPDQRAELLLSLGVDVVITHPFNEEVRHKRAAAFVDELVTHLKMTSLWATADFALGYKREGTIDLLREQGLTKGFTVETVELVMADNNGDKISSGRIRELLQVGDVAKAASYLGRPYRLAGEVVHGEKRGRTIGFPTANVAINSEQMLPKNGVYACWAWLWQERFRAVTNIGNRPTFNGQFVTIEAHLLDFDRDIYGQILTLDFVGHLRDELKFSGIEALVAQIQADVAHGHNLLTE